ncbi:MAG: hypothetical protein NTZ90_09240 [Proteobacteria bacterium]|nr:hypothetical protein [Pseudomonadota bacterium]
MPTKVKALCFVFSSCSMLYYLLLTRLVVEFTGDVMRWSAISSGVYLCTLGLGMIWSERPFKRNLFALVAWIEAAIAVWGTLAVALIYLWHMVYRIHIFQFGYDLGDFSFDQRWVFGAGAELLLVVLGLLSGLEFGLVNQMGFRAGLASVQALIAVYQFGGLLGSILLLLVLAPHFEPLHIAIGMSVVNLAAALAWARAFRQRLEARPAARLLAMHGAALAAVSLLALRVDLPQVHRKNFYYNTYHWAISGQGIVSYFFPVGVRAWFNEAAKYPAVERFQSVYQNIDFVRESPVRPVQVEVPAGDGWTMFMDHHFQVSSEYEVDYHQALAHVPSMLLDQGDQGIARKPSKVLIIGGGDGLLVRELLRQGPDIEHITLIDIDPEILRLASEHRDLLRLNHAGLEDPKVTVMAADAFQAVRGSVETFDQIFVDVLFPFNFETSRLYSAEFFTALHHHLSAQGSLAILSPVAATDVDDLTEQRGLGVLASTFKYAGFNDLYLYGETRHSFFLALPRAATEDFTVKPLAKSKYMRLVQHPQEMAPVHHVVVPLETALVNSILSPTFFGVHDTFF